MIQRIKFLLMPAIIFFAVFSGGGFASGREIEEFILQYGNTAFYSLVIIGILFFLLIFLSIEIARKYSVFNYRPWSKVLLGKWWFIIDILFISLAVIAIAVVSSGASDLLKEKMSLNVYLSNILIFVIIALILFFGEKNIKKFSGVSTIVFFVIIISLFIYLLLNKNLDMSTLMSSKPSNFNWLKSSLNYVSYNVIVIPAILYTYRNIRTRKDSIIISLLSSIGLIFPIGLLIIILASNFPENITKALPIFDLLETHKLNILILSYYIAFFLTLIDTSVGLIHSINERIIDQFKKFDGKKPRLVMTISILFLALLLSYFGIIALVGKGYYIMSYLFFLFCILPILYKGIQVLFNKNDSK